MYYQRRNGTKSLRDLINRVVRPIKRNHNNLASLQEVWSKSVGPSIAQRTRVVKLVNETLTVYADSPVTRHEIEGFLKEEILSKFRKLAGRNGVKRLKCQLINPGAIG